MENPEQNPHAAPPSEERRVSFDEHVQQLPVSRRIAHRWVVRLLLVAFVALIALLVYAVYASVAWKSVGGETVISSWLYFLLAGAAVAILVGADTLIVGATVPPPFRASRYSFISGGGAVRQGWSLIAVGVIGVAFIINTLSVVRKAVSGG